MGARRGATCPVCNKQFAQAYSLTIHMRIHNGEKPFACSTCGRRFTQAHSRTKHERTHTGEKHHECHICGKRFGEAFMLKRHMRVHTGDKPFRCLECGRAFADKFGLTRHLKTHVTAKPHPCTECGQSFSNAWALATHQLQHMGINPSCLNHGDFSGVLKRKAGDTGPITPEAAAVLQASAQAQVQAQVQEQSQLQIQIQLTPADQPQDNQLLDNKKPKMHVCLVCDKGFTDAWGLSKHSWVHTGIKPYSCDECGKGFGDKWGLTKHMRVHTGERPYECFLCGQSYSDKTTLQNHLRVHTGEKPYICDLCGKCFAAVRALEEHRASHGDREQHSCPVCTRIFMTKRGVNEHWKKYCGKNNPNALENVTCVVDNVTTLCTVELKQDQDIPVGINLAVASSNFAEQQVQVQVQAQAEVQVEQTQPTTSQEQQQQTAKELWAHAATWDASAILEVPTPASTGKVDPKNSPCFFCDVCHKTFRQLALLEKHKLTHNSEAVTKDEDDSSPAQESASQDQHRCNLCDKMFPSESCLKTHLESGCSQKNCVLCGKGYRMLTADGAQIITPYCDGCALTQHFDTRGDLIIPKRLPHPPWAFDATHIAFQKHIAVHSDGSKPCSCGNCDGMFSSHTTISTHSLSVPTAGV